MSPSPQTEKAVSVFKVAISSPVATSYQHQADSSTAFQGDVEVLLAERLEKCVEHTSLKPLYLTDSQRQALDKLFKYNISTSEQLLVKVQQALSVDINHVSIPLDPNVLARLKSRALSQPFDKFIATVIREQLEAYVGLR